MFRHSNSSDYNNSVNQRYYETIFKKHVFITSFIFQSHGWTSQEDSSRQIEWLHCRFIREKSTLDFSEKLSEKAIRVQLECH